jgi:hypothetical protein
MGNRLLPPVVVLLLTAGEFRKTCHPRNVEIYEVREMSFQEQRIREGLES